MSRALPEGFTIEEKQIQRIDALMSAMTVEERRNPRIISASRRERIAKGSGQEVQDVNRLLKMHEQMKMMMKMLQGMQDGGGMPNMAGMMNMPGMPGSKGFRTPPKKK